MHTHPSQRIVALGLTLSLLTSCACAGPRPPPVSVREDEPIACRAYRSSVRDTPPASRPGPVIGLLGSALAIGVGIAGIVSKSPPPGPEDPWPNFGASMDHTAHVLGAILLVGGVGGLIASSAALAAHPDPRPGLADRCDEQLARLCPDLGDAACAAALAKACAAGDGAACWVLDLSRPPPGPASGAARPEPCGARGAGPRDPGCVVDDAIKAATPARPGAP